MILYFFITGREYIQTTLNSSVSLLPQQLIKLIVKIIFYFHPASAFKNQFKFYLYSTFKHFKNKKYLSVKKTLVDAFDKHAVEMDVSVLFYTEQLKLSLIQSDSDHYNKDLLKKLVLHPN